MTSRGQRHKKFFCQKLDLLEQERAHVHDVVDTYVSKVVQKANDWLARTDEQQLGSQKLIQLIDNTTMYLFEKGAEIAGEDEEGDSAVTSGTETSVLSERQNPDLSRAEGHTESAELPTPVALESDYNMTSRGQRHKKFFCQKLDLLEQERAHVLNVVDTYVNKVVQKANDQLASTDEQQLLRSQELIQLIDNTTMYLFEKGAEIAGEDEEVDAGTTGTKMSVALDSESTRGDLREVLSRLNILEKTVSSFRGRADDLNTKQEEGENNPETLSAKQAKMKGKLAQMKSEQSDQSEKIENILSQITSMENNQEIRMKKMKMKIDDITKSQGTATKSLEMIEDLKEKVDCLSETLEEMKGNFKEDLDKEVKKLSGKIKKISGDMSNKAGHDANKFSELEDQVISLQETVVEIKKEMSEIDKLRDQMRDVKHKVSAVSEKVTKLGAASEKLSEKVTEIDAASQEMSEKVTKLDAASGTMSQKMKEIDTATEKLSAKLDKTQEMNAGNIKVLLNKILTVRRKRKKDLKGVEARYDKVETQYKMVCSIVADRLLGLERLRDILNRKILARDQMAKMAPQNTPVSAPSPDSKGPQMFGSNLPNSAAATEKPTTNGVVSSPAASLVPTSSIPSASSPSASHSLQSVTPSLSKTIAPQKSASSSLVQDLYDGPIHFKASRGIGLDSTEEDVRDYDEVETNDGFYFDQNKGTFTAPKDGRYRVSFYDDWDEQGRQGQLSLWCVRFGGKREICLCDYLERSKASADRTYLVTLRCGDYLFLKDYLADEYISDCGMPVDATVYFPVSYEG